MGKGRCPLSGRGVLGFCITQPDVSEWRSVANQFHSVMGITSSGAIRLHAAGSSYAMKRR